MVDKLLKHGVIMPDPASVYVGNEVSLKRISKNGVIIYPGSRITGVSTCIMANAKIGYEAPATVNNCQIGPDVELKGGFFEKAVFLAGSSMDSGAHVRAGTILEEQASGAHSVGLKQTILFPFATLGSLINFCDLILAGGTSRKNHSEVGSSYIHFNFTPQKDKATPSLLGDVPRGVMLRENPIFLGGQGGLVGPCCIEYGTVIAAGTVWRKDQKKPGCLVFDRTAGKSRAKFTPGIYKSVKRITQNNLVYIANLLALRMWYVHVRSQFIQRQIGQALYDGLLEKCDMAIAERLKRFAAFCENTRQSARLLAEISGDKAPQKLLNQKRELAEQCADICHCLENWQARTQNTNQGDNFLEIILKEKTGQSYIEAIKGLSQAQAESGAKWLADFVDSVTQESKTFLPSLF